MKPDKNRVKDLLRNWRFWARDVEPDSAEIHYYTISPTFRDYVKPTPKWIRYDNDAADAVEEVLRYMFKVYPDERKTLFMYYICMNNQRDLADALDMSAATVNRRIKVAEDAFAESWEIIFYQ